MRGTTPSFGVSIELEQRDRSPARKAGGRSANALSIRCCETRGDRKVTRRELESRSRALPPTNSGRYWAVRSLELGVLRACEQALNQSSKFLVRQRRKLRQAGVQPLQLVFGHRVEIDTADALVGTRTLQPTQKNLGRTGIGNPALP